MKLRLGISVLLMLIGLVSVAQTNKKIGYANMSELKALLPSYDSLNQVYHGFSRDYEQELMELSDLVSDKSAQIDKEEDAFTRKKLQAEHQDLLSILTERQKIAEQELGQKRKELFGVMDRRLTEACNRIKSRQGYDHIYDSSTSSIPVFLGATDLTQLLKTELGL